MKQRKRLDGFIFRPARLDDVGYIVELELSVWGKEAGAAKEEIISRIETFSKGNFVATLGGRIVAYGSLEYVDDVGQGANFSWAEITDDGFIAKSHKPKGEYIYGVNLSVHHSMNGRDLGSKMVLYCFIQAIISNKRGVFTGSRIPGFSNYLKHYPKTRAEDYITVYRNGKTRDYELRLYEEIGFRVIKVLPDYFPDPPSLDYGVLIYWTNNFFKNPFRKIIGLFFWRLGRIKLTKKKVK